MDIDPVLKPTMIGRLDVPIEFRDSMIAGIALEHRLTIVTRSRRDYGRIPGLTIEEW